MIWIRCSRSLCSSQDTDGTRRTKPPSGEPFGLAVRGVALSEAAASSGPNSVLETLSVYLPSFRTPIRENVLTERYRESMTNSQCSTRKHGRPATQAVTRGARCSLERR
jgi:hypothetical protein